MLFWLAYALLWVAELVYIAYNRTSKRWVGWLATGITLSSLGLLTAGLVQRAQVAGHWPLTNRYEFALCFLWAIQALYLLVEASWQERRAGAYVLAVALLVATYAVTRPAEDQRIMPLLPVLRSVWLQLHTLSALAGYGAAGVAAGLGLMRLMHPASSDEEGQPMQLTWQEIERTMERAIALGFPWITLGLLTGAMWAQNAWGRYWGWDPKESWALVTWLWYLLVLHVRALRTWRGQRLAMLIVAGFGVILFSFLGLPWLVRTVRLESLHAF